MFVGKLFYCMPLRIGDILLELIIFRRFLQFVRIAARGLEAGIFFVPFVPRRTAETLFCGGIQRVAFTPSVFLAKCADFLTQIQRNIGKRLFQQFGACRARKFVICGIRRTVIHIARQGFLGNQAHLKQRIGVNVQRRYGKRRFGGIRRTVAVGRIQRQYLPVGKAHFFHF